MYWNDTMARKARMMVSKMRRLRKSNVRPYRERNEITPLLSTFKDNGGQASNGSIHMNGINGHASKSANGTNGVHGGGRNGVNGTTLTINHLYPIEEDDIGKIDYVFFAQLRIMECMKGMRFLLDFADSPWSVAHDTSYCTHVLRWPITLMLWLTIPDCRRHPSWKMVTFALCIAWIGFISYVVAMLITIVGMCDRAFILIIISR